MIRLPYTYFYAAVFAIYLTDMQPACGEIFSSMADVETLLQTERAVLDLLRNLRDRETEKLNAAREYVQKLRKGTDTDQAKKGESIFSHPISAFHFIRRHTVDWQNLKDVLVTNITEDTVQALKVLRTQRRFPDNGDIKGTVEGFLRLQATYKIRANEIADGRISKTRATPSFTSQECFIVGNKQAEAGFYGSAVQWLEVALDKYHAEEEKTSSLVEILDWLQFSVYQSNRNASRALEISLIVKELEPTFENVDANLRHYKSHLANLSAEERTKMNAPANPYKEDTEDNKYETLCRGELKVARRVLRNQRCYYETYKNPFLLLRPVKTEVVHVDPDIFILHDVLLTKQMDRIRSAGQEYLKRAQIIASKGSGQRGLISTTRVSKTAFLDESVDPVIGEVNILTGHITNLSAKQAELLQINNYGIAGLYLPHLDYLNDPDKLGTHLIEPQLGDRIATFLVYMTDVEAGGATVFPELNLTLYPEKGAAAFWYNLYKDGAGDVRTLHAGCPVLSGSKWVANKWFREVGQDVTRPCGLRPDSPQPVAD